MQIVNSITVAGAVPALPDVESDAPVSRLTCKKRDLQAPEREGANLPEWQPVCQELLAKRRCDDHYPIMHNPGDRIPDWFI